MNYLRLIPITICIFVFLVIASYAQVPVTVTVETRSTGATIPDDFIGESFETASLRLNVNGVNGHLFDSTNTQLATIFRNLGLKSLRIGGASVDNLRINPTHDDIDALFGFAKALDLKVIYSFRLLNGNAEEDASIAKYIEDRYSHWLDCFAIGNEPDWHSFHTKDPEIFEMKPGVPGSAYPSYLVKWKKIATAICDSVPGAKFTGPDAGSNYPVPRATDTYFDGKPWTVDFAEDIASWRFPEFGRLRFVTQHNYVGQDAKSQRLSPEVMADRMLSPDWNLFYYPALYNAIGTPALPKGCGYRMTESNSFSGGVKDGSDCYATALYALDYLHWWAAHNCLGVNYHTTQWRYNGTIYLDKDGQYQIHPIGYGIKAFDLGGHGQVKQVAVSNPLGLNMTAYAVDDSGRLFVTIINKEYCGGAREADVSINAAGVSGKADVIYLSAGDGNILSATGITLGGAPITNNAPWQGQWNPVVSSAKDHLKIDVPPYSAAIVRIEPIAAH